MRWQKPAAQPGSLCGRGWRSTTNISKNQASSLPLFVHLRIGSDTISRGSHMTLLDNIDSSVRSVLSRALDGDELSWQDGLDLCRARGREFQALIAAADELRRRQ